MNLIGSLQEWFGSKRNLVLTVLGLIIVVVVVGFLLWRNQGLGLFEEAHAAFEDGRCPEALPGYDDLAGYPRLLGKFVDQAANERTVCQDYEEAAAQAAASDEAASIAAFESFLSAHADSPLTPPALAGIEQTYLGWGESLRSAGEYEQSVSTYHKLGDDHPQSGQQAAEGALRAYQDWGESLRQTGAYAESLSVLEELLARHPDFQEQAEADISETYLAWADSLRQGEAFSQSVATLEELAARYPVFHEQAEDQLLASYLDWGQWLRQDQAYPEALGVYMDLEDRYPSFGEQARAQILPTYLAWSESLAADVAFEEAVDALDELAAAYETFQSPANDQLQTTFLEWADHLRQEEGYVQSIQVYDLMMDRNASFFDAGVEPRNETYLEWAESLLATDQYAEAELVYRTLLQREHDRLAPLPLDPQAWPAETPAPFGVMQIREPGAFLEQVRTGPGEQYDPVERAAGTGSGNLVAIVGTNTDASWLAIDISSTGSGDIKLGRLDKIDWFDSSGRYVIWLPESAAVFDLLTIDTVPLAGPYVQALAEASESAASAQAGLVRTYQAWATAAEQSGNLETSLTSTLADANLVTDGAQKQALWQQAATLFLSKAESENASNAYEASLQSAVLAECYDVSGDLFIPARSLQTSNLLATANAYNTAGGWEAAVETYEEVLAMEPDTFAFGMATVNRNQVSLYDAAGAGGGRIETAALNDAFPALASTQTNSDAWALLLVSTVESGLGWVPASQISLTIPFEDLPSYESVELPPLGSPEALRGLAGSQQAWGQALHDDHAYDDALAHYQIILEDPALTSIITGTDELASESWLAWGLSLFAAEEMTDGVGKLAEAIIVAPGTEAAAEATSLLTDVIAELENAEDEAVSCDDVAVLDAMLATPLERRAGNQMPRALYLCGQSYHAEAAFEQASPMYQRVVDEYANSAFASRARRGLLTLDWIALVDDIGISDAAEEVCSVTGATVRAGLAALDTPHVVYASGSGLSTSDLPSEWTGTALRTTVIVCTEDIQSTRLERCPYALTGSFVANAWIDRYRSYRDMRIVDPVSRLTVASNRFYGSYPDTCPATEFFSGSGAVKNYYGSQPSEDELLNWLEGRIVD